MFSVLPHSTFTVQILYKLYSLKLNCTYCNCSEAPATCSAEQQYRISQAGVLCCAVQQVVWYYIVTHIQRLNVIKEFNCLKTYCRKYTVLNNSTVWSCTAIRNEFLCVDVIQGVGYIRHDVCGKHLTQIDTTHMTQCARSKRLSLPSTVQ